MTKTEIEVLTKNLADLCLENAEIYHKYTDEDLINAALIFSHFLIDMIYTQNKYLSQNEKEDLAETTGKAIRELIIASCGKDMHTLVKNQFFSLN